MKQSLLITSLILLLSACSEESNISEQENIQAKEIQMFQIPETEIINQQFSFSQQSPITDYANKNELINAINGAIKCTLTPHNEICTKLRLPKFILMDDESLQRPSKMQYQITKIKPLAGGMLHIYTKSNCDNNWFGLCQGNIIYVLENKQNSWYVSDVFALADNQ